MMWIWGFLKVDCAVMFESKVKQWICDDPERHRALVTAAEFRLNDWCIAAGFVRNLVWDKLHSYAQSTPLADIDLIYFDAANISTEFELAIENTLKEKSGLNWSVKNQARMHHRNADQPYRDAAHAMMHWVEVETAVSARLSNSGELEVVAPFGLENLQNLTITLNQYRPKLEEFHSRIRQKQWLDIWPKLRVVE